MLESRQRPETYDVSRARYAFLKNTQLQNLLENERLRASVHIIRACRFSSVGVHSRVSTICDCDFLFRPLWLGLRRNVHTRTEYI